MGAEDRTVVLRVAGALSVRAASALCRAIETAVRAASQRVVLDLLAVDGCDAVGLAVLLQALRRAAPCGVGLEMRAGAGLRPSLLRARLVEVLPLAEAGASDAAPTTYAVESSPRAAPVAVGRLVRLRPPAAEEIAFFARWAEDGLLDQMVGSRLLYCCRHLGPGHPAFVEHALHDPTALVLLVEPLARLWPPAGFLRLHAIDLRQRFALLEVAPVGVVWPRRGWLDEALALLLAWALDVLELERVEAQACAHDAVGAETLVAAGFTREGLLRGALVYGGRRRDVLLFSVLAAEMRGRRERAGIAPLSPWSAEP